MLCAGAGDAARKDLSALADAFAETRDILIVYVLDLVDAELALLLAVTGEARTIGSALLLSGGSGVLRRGIFRRGGLGCRRGGFDDFFVLCDIYILIFHVAYETSSTQSDIRSKRKRIFIGHFFEIRLFVTSVAESGRRVA